MKLVSCTVPALAVLLTNVAYAQSVMTHHVREAALSGAAPLISVLPADQIMSLDVVLVLSDPAGLQTFLNDIYNSSSPNYRHFLSVPEFTERFGPSQQDYDQVIRFAQTYGFTITGGTRDGMEVQMKGPVSSVEAAFHLTMRTYQDPTANREFYAPDREPTTNLAFNLWHVSGLDNYSIPHPLFVKKSDYAKTHNLVEAGVVGQATTGSGPSASFLGSDMRAAYYGGTALTGAGQNLGLFEYEGTDLTDLTTYFNNVGQTNHVPVTLLSTDGTSTSCVSPSCDDTEQTLDMTQAIGMAPDLASLVMYVGSVDTAIISAMTTHSPLPATIGCSWGWTPADASTLDPYFQKMAAQGQNFFVASGDSSTWSASNEAWPADDANIVSVGGTDLVTVSAGGAWKSETAWADSGGGISPDKIAIPAWQQLSGVITSTNKGSTTLRNGPDVSANANFSFYVCADQTTCTANEYGGTSFAAPMWAGYIALVNQQLVADGKPTIGFLNPTIYAQNVTSDYSADFHDITSGKSGSYSAVVGYDLVTGWGSPSSGLISALTAGSGTSTFSMTASPTSVTVAQGSSGTSTITTTISGSFDSAIALSASGLPTGATAGFNPSSISAPGTGSSTLTITVGSATPTGTYTITVTGTGGGVTQTASVSLTVSSGSTPSFTISASPASVTIAQGSSGTSKVSTTVAGGFDSAIALSASGLPSGVTASFNPSSIAAPGSGSSTLTLTASSSAATGTYTVTITGTGGGLTHTTTVALTVSTGSTPSFTLTANPTSVTVQPGSTGTSTITAAISGGFNGAIALSSSGEPSGVTASFSPTSIPAPGSGTSTMTLTVSSSAVAGTYTINVIGTGTGGVVENTTVSLTVSSASTNLIVNGGFETGTFSGWTAGGPIEPTVTKAEAQSGSYSALLGRTAAPEVDGNSAIYQAITIPSTASKVTLTFSYWPGTNDSIQYAYQDAMILNSSGNRLATVLEVSSNARSWQEVTYDLTSYKGKTILVYFGVHGDGYEPDYVYMYLDNVSVTVQ
jgi:Pro-kumamolisin, activation domain